MNLKTSRTLFLFVMTIVFSGLHAGYQQDTRVLMAYGNVTKIKDVSLSDKIMGVNKGNVTGINPLDVNESPIVAIVQSRTYETITLNTTSGKLIIGDSARLYDPVKEKFVFGENITRRNFLFDGDGNAVHILSISRKIHEDFIATYDIALKEPHLFFVLTTEGIPILAHNIDPVLTPAAIAYLASLGLAFEGGAIVATGAGTGIAAGTGLAFGTVPFTTAIVNLTTLGIGGTVVAVAAPVVVVAGSAYIGVLAYKGIKSYFHHKRCKRRARRNPEPPVMVDIDQIKSITEEFNLDKTRTLVPLTPVSRTLPSIEEVSIDVVDPIRCYPIDDDTLKDILKDAELMPKRGSGPATNYRKPGGEKQLKKDFHRFEPDQQPRKINLDKGEKGLLKVLKNGDNLVRRLAGQGKKDTLEFQKAGSPSRLKIRY